jgi:hypothetical protein
VDIIDIKIINKPSLSQAIEGFYEELNNNKTPISKFFKENIQTLLENSDDCTHSKQR